MPEEQQAKMKRNKKYQNRGLMEDIKALYLNTKAADVNFKFSTGDRIPAHKNLLFVVSNVFDAMFFGDLKETGDIEITDSSPAAFKEFLQFFYSNEIELTEENIEEVMYLVQKYNISNGVDVCKEFLKDILTADNVFIGLNIAMLHELKELIKFCEKIIISNTNAVFGSTSFLECDKKTLDHILKMNFLSCSEVKIFEACMQWVKAKSRQNILTKDLVGSHLDESFYQIRFASMTMQELCTLPTEYDAVLADDFKLIAKIISVPGFCSSDFNTCPRIPKWNEAASIKCDRVLLENLNTYRYRLGCQLRMIFSSNELLLPGGFECGEIELFDGRTIEELISDLPTEVKVTEGRITKNNQDAHHFLMTMKTELNSKNPSILLPQPILI